MESSPQVNRYPQVNLYIETTVHGPRQQGGRWMYLLEFVTRRGDPVTLWKVGDWEAEKENVLIMQALSAALDRLRLPCVINAHAGSSQIRSTIENGWLEEWQERGWKTAKGQDIKHKDLWQEIALKMAPHLVFMRSGGHSYQLWMQEKLKKMVETPQETR